KEDVLFLVYEAINDHVDKRLHDVINQHKPSIRMLRTIVDSYFRLMDDMQDEVTILYQEVKSLEPSVKETVLERERKKVLILKTAIMECVPHQVEENEAELIANNLFVQGHMWGFRRWVLYKHFTIDEYIDMQSQLLFQSLKIENV